MLTYTLYTLFVISCFVLILVVLLQPGKGDVASALGGGVSGAAFGPRGTTTLLAKITIGAAVAFMGIGFALSVPGLVTNRSVTSGVTEQEVPQDETTGPADGGAPAAPQGAIPGGQVTVDQNGQVSTEAPAQPAAPAGAAPAAPAAPPAADKKPEPAPVKK